MAKFCDDETMRALISAMQDDSNQIERVDDLLKQYPDDGRLHFLRGSMLVAAGRLIEGHQSLIQAVDAAPDLAIARFQLGLFQLTSGEADRALETWGRLDRLPDGHYLRKFVDGLRCLVRDDFAGAIENLRQGVALNQENSPLNRDMDLLIGRCQAQLGGAGATQSDAASETSLILRQFSGLKNLH